MIFRVVIFLFLFLAGCNSTAPSLPLSLSPSPTPRSPLPAPLYSLRVGWAYEAYPEASFDKMSADMARMRENGANAIWLGHNNPGNVDATKLEPGMSYAVYSELQDVTAPLFQDAREMADAVKRALAAAREAHLKVILPVGYQIQMGEAWNHAHPNDLRRKSDGRPLNMYNSGFTASPYSQQYRADIARYYEWIQREWVDPYRDVIVMLSLADEPMGGDYSDAAKQEFSRRYGQPMDTLAPNERWHIGEFQAGVIADYATWSANEWQRINPNILTTMSFHGGETARHVWGLPDPETLFAQTPGNFIVSFDAYLHDDVATKPATRDEAAQLKLFLTTIGYYSRVYKKPIALWGGVNAWGLAQESSSPLGIPDAVTNLVLLHDLPTRVGGNVWGIFAWNYNVKQQGLENYERPTTYDPQSVEVAVNRSFPILRTRRIEPSRATRDIAILVSRREMYNSLAASRRADIPPLWFDTTAYARAFADRSAVILTSAPALDTTQDVSYIVLAASSTDLDDFTWQFLRHRFDEGTIILARDATLAQQWNVPAEIWTNGTSPLPTDGGKVYIYDLEGE